MCLLDFLCFRNSVEKLCVSWALSLIELRSSRGAETTSTSC